MKIKTPPSESEEFWVLDFSGDEYQTLDTNVPLIKQCKAVLPLR